MTNEELNSVLHDLVSIQNTFRSYEQLANKQFSFQPKPHFRKCILKIQMVIDHGREMARDENNRIGDTVVSQ